MGKKKIKITHQQGQTLLMISTGFVMPPKLGTTEITLIERGNAAEEVRALYRELKARSPLYQKDKKFVRFGDGDNWERHERTTDSPAAWIPKDPELETEIRLDEDAHMGAFRILLTLLHPGSETRASVGMAEDILWPLAERLRLTGMLRKEMKVEGEYKRRLILDGTPSDTENEVEELNDTNSEEEDMEGVPKTPITDDAEPLPLSPKEKVRQ